MWLKLEGEIVSSNARKSISGLTGVLLQRKNVYILEFFKGVNKIMKFKVERKSRNFRRKKMKVSYKVPSKLSF